MNIKDKLEELIKEVKSSQIGDLFNSPIIIFDNLNKKQ